MSDRVGDVLALVVEYGESIGDGVERLVDDRLLRSDLADEVVEAVGCGNDVAFLIVEVTDVGVELADQAP